MPASTLTAASQRAKSQAAPAKAATPVAPPKPSSKTAPAFAAATVEMPPEWAQPEDELADDKPLTPEEPVEEDGSEDELEDFEEPDGESEDDEDEPDETQDEPKPVAGEAINWAEVLLTSPQRISELRGSERAEAIRQSHILLAQTFQAQAEQAIMQARVEGRNEGQRMAAANYEYERLDALESWERDEEFKEKPELERLYLSMRLNRSTPPPPPPSSNDQALIGRAAAKFASVAREWFAPELLKNESAGKYPITLAGYEALVEDIQRFQLQGPPAPEAPPREAAAAKRLKAAPKSASASGAGATGPLTALALSRMTPAEIRRFEESRPDGEELVNKAMAQMHTVRNKRKGA